MPTTYEPIATTTLSSAAASITFSSIPATYTDLRLVFVGQLNTGSANLTLRFNGDTGTNYSNTNLGGDGSTAQSVRQTSTSRGYINSITSINATSLMLQECDIMNYAGSTNKTTISKGSADKNGSGGTEVNVMLWRNTSAITSVQVLPDGNSLNTGTTATLYGIKNA